MGNVKTALEKAMEKLEGIGSLTAEEKEEIKDREKIKAVLAAFYKGEIRRDEIWEKLKGGKPSLLREAQQNLADSIRLNSVPEELQQRKDGILAIESIKEKQNTAAIEHILNSIGRMQREYREIREQAFAEIRTAIEQNPQLRMRPAKGPDGRTVYQASLSVDEAVQERLAEFLSEHDRKYDAVFAKTVEKLKKEIK